LGIDVLHPRYDDLSNIQSGKDNPEGWRMVEMPLYQASAVLALKLFPQISIEMMLRIISIISVALSVVFLGRILTTFTDEKTATIGMFLYSVLPFSIYYGRTILPDSFAVCLALGSLVCLLKSHSKKWFIWIILAGISAALSVLVRPMAVFLLVPALYLITLHGSRTQKIISLVLYGVIMSIPLLWWRQWILQYPEGIAVSDWLYNKADIRLGPWFYWIFAKRIGEPIWDWDLFLLASDSYSRNKKDAIISHFGFWEDSVCHHFAG
jgi:4-amino-4-deoxy-L-arabinose transferase-like glycosyltransferase